MNYVHFLFLSIYLVYNPALYYIWVKMEKEFLWDFTINSMFPFFHFFLVVLTESIIILHMYQYALVFYRFEDAIPDFESVLKLNKDIACAHVNLGLIYMNHYENYHR